VVDAASLLRKDALLQIVGGLSEVDGAAQTHKGGGRELWSEGRCLSANGTGVNVLLRRSE
jgi:hypothetical protein